MSKLAHKDPLEIFVASMARIGACRSPSFSPNGKQLAFISDLSGIPQVWIVATEGGWPMRVTHLDEPIDVVAWSPDGAWLAFQMAPGGGSQQVYLVRPNGSELRCITGGGSTVNFLDGWQVGGRRLEISSNRRNPEAIDVYLVDVESGQWQLVFAGGQGDSCFTDISPDGRYAVLSQSMNREASVLSLLDLQNGKEVLLTPQEGATQDENGRFSPDGRTVYFRSNYAGERMAFAQMILGQDGKPEVREVLAARDDAELDSFVLTADRQVAALVWNVAGRDELEFLRLTDRMATPGPRLPAETIHGALTFTKDSKLLALTLSGSTSPQDIYVYNREQERLWQVTHSSHAGVDLANLVRPELMHFRGHDALALSGWLYRPHKFGSPGPLALHLHGGPDRQERPVFRPAFQALLAQGIAVFAPNVRGSTGFGKTFRNLDNGALRLNAIRDIKASVDFVVATGIADPTRIGIEGDSFGGYMVMAGLTEYPDLFVAGVNFYGMIDFEAFFAHTEPWQAAGSKFKIGDPETDIELLRRLSPLHKLDCVTAPTLVLHGAKDTVVPVTEAEQIVQNLTKRGVSVKYVLFPDEGHGFHKEHNRIRAMVEMVRWFVEHLLASK